MSAEQQQELLDYLITNESSFTAATIVRPGEAAATVDEQLRKARTLDNLGPFETMFAEAIKERLAPALDRLGHPAFPVGQIELQATASNDGDYFHLHADSEPHDTREISFVYFLHRLPRRFSGGELRIFRTKVVDEEIARADRSRTLSARPGVLVFFPSQNQHQVLPVRVPSKQFSDSRFTINGWIHRAT